MPLSYEVEKHVYKPGNETCRVCCDNLCERSVYKIDGISFGLSQLTSRIRTAAASVDVVGVLAGRRCAVADIFSMHFC